MTSAPDAFRLAHGGEIQEALIMIEGDDGGFKLRACGWLGEISAQGASFARVSGCAVSAASLPPGRLPERDAR